MVYLGQYNGGELHSLRVLQRVARGADVPVQLGQLVAVVLRVDAEVLVLGVGELTVEVLQQDQQLVLPARHHVVDVFQPQPGRKKFSDPSKRFWITVHALLPKSKLHSVYMLLVALMAILYTPVFVIRRSWHEWFLICRMSTCTFSSLSNEPSTIETFSRRRFIFCRIRPQLHVASSSGSQRPFDSNGSPNPYTS
uniref:Uncharacterized protein n=1 Tax=Anopheles atroparvus TaxID=41427 RepID=A0A182JDC0_ANOAO